MIATSRQIADFIERSRDPDASQRASHDWLVSAYTEQEFKLQSLEDRSSRLNTQQPDQDNYR
jgi:hypothetical protein